MNRERKYLLLNSSSAPGFSVDGNAWYVDSVGGSDSNDGHTAAAAKQTLAGITLLAGQSVGLAKGSTWNEQLTITVDNVTVSSYGTGALPVIDCSDVFTTWADSTDRADANTLVYSKSIPFVSYDTSAWVNVFEDGAYMLRATSLANCQATAGTYWTAATNPQTTATLYIHPTGDGDPDTNGKVYRVPVRAHGIDARGQSGITIDGIQTQRSYHQGGGVKVGDNALVKNCTLLYGNSHNILCGEGSTIQDCIIKYAYYGTSSNSYIVFNKSILTGLPITVTGCTIGEDSYNAFYSSLAVGMYCHHNTSGDFGTLTLTNNTWRYIGIGITCNYTAGMIATGETFTDCDFGIRVDQATATHALTTCTFTNVRTAGNIRFVSLTTGTGLIVTMTGCTYTAARTSNAAIFGNKASTTVTLSNCSFNLTGNATTPQAVWLTGTSGITLSMNNVRFIGNFWQYQAVITDDLAAVYAGNNNCFDGQFAFACQYRGASYSSIANWRVATGQDAASTVDGCS